MSGFFSASTPGGKGALCRYYIPAVAASMLTTGAAALRTLSRDKLSMRHRPASKDSVTACVLVYAEGKEPEVRKKEFQTHFRRLGFRGSIIGGLAAIAFFATASLLSSWWAHSPGGDEIAAMFGSFALGSYGYVALTSVCAAVTLLTGLLSREIVIRHLRTL